MRTFELQIVDSTGTVRTRSVWGDHVDASGHPENRARLQREVGALVFEDDDVAALYSYASPDVRQFGMTYVAAIQPSHPKGSK